MFSAILASVLIISMMVPASASIVPTELIAVLAPGESSAGFVTGGGWIDTQTGAYKPVVITITNGSFETGDYTGWTLWEGDPAVPSYGTWGIAQHGQVANFGDPLFDYYDGIYNLVNTDGAPITFEASDGTYVAFNLQSGGQSHRMYQDITIPNNCDATLSWDMKYDNHASGFDPSHQYLAVHIRDTSDTIVETIFKTTEGVDPLTIPMTSFSKSISAYDGTTVRLDVEAVLEYYFIDALAFDNFVVSCDYTGKANFGFVSKFKNGAFVPIGNTEFQFHAAGLNFHSSSYDWLVVTGRNYAKFEGVGANNGLGEYKFMIWAGDDDPDTFRIKIWEEDEYGVETVIYDNGHDQPIGGGSIVIHTKK
jgi:hypothetical protein